MNANTKWLRISYWVGAIADGVVAIGMFVEAALARPSPLTGYIPDVPYRYAIAIAGSLMLGWTLLLIWADRHPYERRGVLPITIVAVLGLAGSEGFAVTSGFIPLTRLVPIFLFQAFLVVLFALSYLSSTEPVEQGARRQ